MGLPDGLHHAAFAVIRATILRKSAEKAGVAGNKRPMADTHFSQRTRPSPSQTPTLKASAEQWVSAKRVRIPQATVSELLIRIRHPAKKTFGAATGVSDPSYSRSESETTAQAAKPPL